MDATQRVGEKSQALSGRLDEATRRLWAAVEARALGHGGVSTVASAVGLSRTTLYAGLRELALAPLAIERDEFHGEWNYRLKPRNLGG